MVELTRRGKLMARLSLGHHETIGVIYAELRECDNYELAIEMYKQNGEFFDYLALILSVPPAFCVTKKVVVSNVVVGTEEDYNETTHIVCEWLAFHKFEIIGIEYRGNRSEIERLEKEYIQKQNIEIISQELEKRIRNSPSRILTVNKTEFDSWNVTNVEDVIESVRKLLTRGTFSVQRHSDSIEFCYRTNTDMYMENNSGWR